jgi:hypothetical protein
MRFSMNRFTKINVPKCFCMLTVILFGAGLLFPNPGWGHFSDLSLNIYRIEQGSEYYMDQDIGCISVIKNEKEWPVNTNRGIREIEIEQFLIATDPFGVKHVAVQEGDAPEDMQPTPTWGKWETVPADVLEPGYIRSVKIADLREFFPTMKEIPGEWKVQAVITISRFPYTVTTAEGVSGVLDDRARHGTLESNQLRIMIVPHSGARLKVRVEDLRKADIKAQKHVPVRIYKVKVDEYESGNLSLPETWVNQEAFVSGETDMGGWVTLPDGASCLPEPDPDLGDMYVAIAEYGGKYKEAVFSETTPDFPGWGPKCSGRFADYILFGDIIHEFSVFGLNSVWLRSNVRIVSGDVGAYDECSLCVVPGFEVALDGGAWVDEGATIKGDSVYLDAAASVWDIEYNDLSGSSDSIRGKTTTSLDTPLWEELLNIWQEAVFHPGTDNITVDPQISFGPLSQGNYSDVTVGSHAALELTPGVFHFRNLSMGSHASLICSGQTTIYIAGQILSGSAKSSYVGPAAGSDLSAKDVIVYVNGSNQAVVLGQGTRIRANILALNGSFTSGEGCLLEGSFIARDITIGQKSSVKYDGAFSQDDPEEPPTPTLALTDFEVVDASAGANTMVRLTWRWEGSDSERVDIYQYEQDGDSNEINLIPIAEDVPGIQEDYVHSLGKKETGTYYYYICITPGTDTCTESESITF